MFIADHIVCRGSCVWLLFGYAVLHLQRVDSAGCFTLFLMSCDGWCTVVPPHKAVGWSAVYDCGIS